MLQCHAKFYDLKYLAFSWNPYVWQPYDWRLNDILKFTPHKCASCTSKKLSNTGNVITAV